MALLGSHRQGASELQAWASTRLAQECCTRMGRRAGSRWSERLRHLSYRSTDGYNRSVWFDADMKKTFAAVAAISLALLAGGCSSDNNSASATTKPTPTTTITQPTKIVAPITWDRDTIMAKLEKASTEYDVCKSIGTTTCSVAISRGDQVVDSVRTGIAQLPEWAPVLMAINDAKIASTLLQTKCSSGVAAQESVAEMTECMGALRTVTMLPEEAQARLTLSKSGN